MSFIAAAVIGGGLSIVGGLIGSDAARHAGNVQADASKAGTAAQLQMFNTINQQQLPYRQSGYNALNALNYGLGLPGSPTSVPSGNVASPSAVTGGMPNIGGTLRIGTMIGSPGAPTAGAPTRDQFTTTGAGTPGGLRAGGVGSQTYAGYLPNTPGATTFDQAGFDKATADYNVSQGAPGTSMPQTGANGLSEGQFTHQFNASDLNANLAPNYQFQLDQGLGAVKNAGNLSTGLVSGNTLKGINDYAQNYAGGAYQQAYNNYNSNQTNIFNRLSSIAGLGQMATANTGTAATAAGTGIANTLQAGGAGQAAGIVGGANAASGALNNAGGWYGLSQIMNAKYGGDV